MLFPGTMFGDESTDYIRISYSAAPSVDRGGDGSCRIATFASRSASMSAPTKARTTPRLDPEP